MSLIAITMNLMLMALLLAALGMGWQLNRRLKTLKDSQAGFAKAVSELDGAAKRAEAGLADLRSATAEANQVLSERIAMARDLAGKLDAKLQEPLPLEGRGRDGGVGAGLSKSGGGQPLSESHRPAPPPQPLPSRGRGAPTRQALSRRSALDEDLFEDAPMVLGARR